MGHTSIDVHKYFLEKPDEAYFFEKIKHTSHSETVLGPWAG